MLLSSTNTRLEPLEKKNNLEYTSSKIFFFTLHLGFCVNFETQNVDQFGESIEKKQEKHTEEKLTVKFSGVKNKSQLLFNSQL